MTDVTFRDDVTVICADSMGGEGSIVRRARVSTAGADSIEIPADVLAGNDLGLLKWLYKNGHGTPFEGVEFEFYFEVPVFVSRQIVKHRLSSINEESGRYRELRPVFYLTPENSRKICQVGKTGDYNFVEGTPEQMNLLRNTQKKANFSDWEDYQTLINAGIAKEVARETLPFNIYTSMYFKANLRSVLNFIMLRKDWGPDAAHRSHAQYEIELVANKLVDIVKEKVPNVWESFVASGYKAV